MSYETGNRWDKVLEERFKQLMADTDKTRKGNCRSYVFMMNDTRIAYRTRGRSVDV